MFYLSYFEHESPFIKCWIPYNSHNRLNYEAVTSYKSQLLKTTKVHFLHCMSVSCWHMWFLLGGPGWQSLAICNLVLVSWNKNIENYTVVLKDFCPEVTQITCSYVIGQSIWPCFATMCLEGRELKYWWIALITITHSRTSFQVSSSCPSLTSPSIIWPNCPFCPTLPGFP